MNEHDLSALGTAETLRPIEWLWFDEIRFDPATEHWLVKGLLDVGAFGLIYGPPSCGKSFLALDLSLHVAAGWEWFGRRTKPGTVAYVAAEGQHGFKRRVEAFRQSKMAEDAGPIPFALVPTSLNLLDPAADTPRLIGEIEARRTEAPFALIVVDTVSRSLAGGDENGPELGAFIANCDAIRQATGAALLAVHHSGKDSGRGSRGWNGLPAAADMVLEVEGEAGTRVATVRKQKEGAVGEQFAFELECIDLGTDTDGDPVTSCVVRPAEATARPSDARKITGAAKTALDLLKRALDDAGEVPPASNHIPAGVRAVRAELWREYCARGQITETDNPDSKRRAFKRAAERLQSLGAIACWGDFVWIP